MSSSLLQQPPRSPSPLSEPRPNDDAQHAQAPNSNDDPQSISDASSSATAVPAVRNILRSRRALCKIVLMFTCLLVFCVSLMLAVQHWSDQEEDKDAPFWKERSCTIISTSLEAHPANASMYRVTANVTNLGLPNEPVAAYYGASPSYLLPKPEAEQIFGSLTNDNTSCWLSDSDPPFVSLVEIQGEHGSPQSSFYIAWAAIFIAAAVGVVLLVLLCQIVQNFLADTLQSPSERGPRSPEEAKSPHLTSRQTEYVCERFSKELSSVDDSDWVCSICLEEDEPNSVQLVVQLPCEHCYHRSCISSWLRKGKGACPLCNWDTKTLFKATGDPDDGDPESAL